MTYNKFYIMSFLSVLMQTYTLSSDITKKIYEIINNVPVVLNTIESYNYTIDSRIKLVIRILTSEILRLYGWNVYFKIFKLLLI